MSNSNHPKWPNIIGGPAGRVFIQQKEKTNMKKIAVRLDMNQIDLFRQMLVACHDLSDDDVNGDLIKLNAYLQKRMNSFSRGGQ